MKTIVPPRSSPWIRSTSSALFRIKHLDAAYFYGRFNEITGTFKVDDQDLDKSYVRIEIPTESVDSNNEARDKHLKSQDFFSAKEFPTITFKSTKIEKVGDDSYKVTGELTFRGVTKTITFGAQHTGTGEVNPRFGLRSGYEATLEIKRSEFGVKYGLEGSVLADAVRLIVALEGAAGT